VLQGVPARISLANSPSWETHVGAENAPIYRAAVENSLVEDENNHYDGWFWIPIEGWLSQAYANISDGNDPAQELALAQQYADDYLDCMSTLDIASLHTKQLMEEANICRAQVDPNYQ